MTIFISSRVYANSIGGVSVRNVSEPRFGEIKGLSGMLKRDTAISRDFVGNDDSKRWTLSELFSELFIEGLTRHHETNQCGRRNRLDPRKTMHRLPDLFPADG